MRSTDITQTIHRPYHEQLNYFVEFILSGVHPLLRNAALEKFLVPVNDRLARKEGKEPLKVTTEDLNSYCTGEAIPPAMDVAEALLDTFAEQLHIPEDLYWDCWEAANGAIVGRTQSREDLTDLDVRQTIVQAEEDAAAIQERKRQLRKKTNPNHNTSLPSFIEMLEVSHEAGENFVSFLFNRVFPTWKISPEAFCEHMEDLNRSKDIPKATITNTSLYNWRLGKGKPLRDSLSVICSAFDIGPQKNEVMALHEIMLWKAINGHCFQWRGMEGKDALDMAIEETKASDNTGPLVIALMDASGIRFERIKEVLQNQQLNQWRKGAKIENLDTAMGFLAMVNPNVKGKKFSPENCAILSLLTGRTFDLDTLIKEAKTADNPGGALFVSLTGRKGLVSLAPDKLAEIFTAAGNMASTDKVRKMRNGGMLQGGGKIKEAFAKTILEQVESAAVPLRKQGVVKSFTDQQKEECIELFTGCPHPKKLLADCVAGKMRIGDMVRSVYERRGLNQQGDNSFCEEVGVKTVSDFTLGKANTDHETAQKLADWFARNYKFSEREQQQFMVLTTGASLEKSADTILDEVMRGSIPRQEGLKRLYDLTGYSREAMADKAGIPPRAIMYSTQTHSGTRIIAETDQLRALGALIGISTTRLNDFIATFDGHAIFRQQALSAGQQPTSHTERNIKEKSGGNRFSGGRYVG